MVLPWVFPIGPLQQVLPVAGVYLRALGLRQGWFMFAAGPAGSQHLVSRVERTDGTVQVVELPPVAAMDNARAWVDYRYRELEHRLISGHPLSIRDPEPAWRHVAEQAARQADEQATSTAAPVQRVRLETCGLPTPSVQQAAVLGKDTDWSAALRDPERWTCETFYLLDLAAQP